MNKNNQEGFQMYGGFKEKIWWPLTKSSGIFFFIFLLLVGGFVSVYFLNIPILTRSTIGQILTTKSSHKYPPQNTNITGHEVPLNCTAYGSTRTCPSNNNNSVSFLNRSSESTCPNYYRWIYEDLRPWAHTGVSREMIEKVKSLAHFRLVILNGNAYVEKYRSSFQTRDVFTLWGVLQLLRMYPGKVPDLELMFNCNDRLVINLRDYSAINATHPPPLFRYCSDDSTLDIPFPDWSFWGWPEIKIKPWEPLMKDLLKGNKLRRWVKREPYAYWKGNPYVAQTRRDLLKCNVSEKQDWNARLYIQDWVRESKEGFNKSNLANQCTHRFKIYIEGNAWSVSEKYILACDSLTLLVNPKFYDFFSRGLRPMQHYWPIKANDKCRSIKHAVDWGNTHMKEAQAIGKAWICNCGFHNYSSRVQCKKCNAFPPALGTKRLASDEFVHDWDNKRLNTNGQEQSYPGFESLVGTPVDSKTGAYAPYPNMSTGVAPSLQVPIPLQHQATAPTLLGKGAKQWRDGDWMCTNCNNHNYASRSHCNRCKAQRDMLAQPVNVM